MPSRTVFGYDAGALSEDASGVVSSTFLLSAFTTPVLLVRTASSCRDATDGCRAHAPLPGRIIGGVSCFLLISGTHGTGHRAGSGGAYRADRAQLELTGNGVTGQCATVGVIPWVLLRGGHQYQSLNFAHQIDSSWDEVHAPDGVVHRKIAGLIADLVG